MSHEEINALCDQLDAATNAVADRIAAIVAELSASVTPAEADAIKVRLTAEVDRLRGLAADPANPVP